MSHILPFNKRSEGNIIDYTIKCSRKLLWNVFLNISLFKYSKKGRKAERKKEERKERKKKRREKGEEGGRKRERKRTEGRRGKKIVFKSVLIPGCLEAPHGCVMHTVPGTNSSGIAGRAILKHKLVFMQNLVKSHSCFLDHLIY